MFRNQRSSDYFGIRLILFSVLCIGMVLVLYWSFSDRSKRPAGQVTPSAAATPEVVAGPIPDQVNRVLQPLLAKGAVVEKQAGFAGKYPLYVARQNGRIAGVAYAINSPADNLGLPQILLGLDSAGQILGLAVLAPAANKPGAVTDLAALEAWFPQLISQGGQPRTLRNTNWRLVKDKGNIEPPTAGDAVRPIHVLVALHEALVWYDEHRNELTASSPTPISRRADPSRETGGVPDHNLRPSKPFPPAQPGPTSPGGATLAQ